MARILKDVFFSFDGVNLSSFCKEISLTYEVDERDVTTMPDSTVESFPGLKKWRITAKLLQSFASAEVDETLFPLIGDEAGAAVIVRVTSAAKSATNPEFTGTGILLKYPPISGSVGDLHEVDIEIAAASALSRGV
jgi:hypothetical protein